jgi:general stress protein 26
VSESEKKDFFRDAEAATKKAIWCALATSGADGRPRVRIVHPTWDGDALWFATGTTSPKIAQIRANPWVDVQFQVAPPDFVHLMVRGRAQCVDDTSEKRRVWDVIDYDLSQFWPGGPADPNYTPVRIDPERVELSKMFGSVDRRVWLRR